MRKRWNNVNLICYNYSTKLINNLVFNPQETKSNRQKWNQLVSYVSTSQPFTHGCEGSIYQGDILQCKGGIKTFSDNVIPDGYTGFCNIDILHLNFEGNYITKLPDGVFDGLPSLQELSLDLNELTNLPGGIRILDK